MENLVISTGDVGGESKSISDSCISGYRLYDDKSKIMFFSNKVDKMFNPRNLEEKVRNSPGPNRNQISEKNSNNVDVGIGSNNSTVADIKNKTKIDLPMNTWLYISAGDCITPFREAGFPYDILYRPIVFGKALENLDQRFKKESKAYPRCIKGKLILSYEFYEFLDKELGDLTSLEQNIPEIFDNSIRIYSRESSLYKSSENKDKRKNNRKSKNTKQNKSNRFKNKSDCEDLFFKGLTDKDQEISKIKADLLKDINCPNTSEERKRELKDYYNYLLFEKKVDQLNKSLLALGNSFDLDMIKLGAYKDLDTSAFCSNRKSSCYDYFKNLGDNTYRDFTEGNVSITFLFKFKPLDVYKGKVEVVGNKFIYTCNSSLNFYMYITEDMDDLIAEISKFINLTLREIRGNILGDVYRIATLIDNCHNTERLSLNSFKCGKYIVTFRKFGDCCTCYDTECGVYSSFSNLLENEYLTFFLDYIGISKIKQPSSMQVLDLTDGNKKNNDYKIIMDIKSEFDRYQTLSVLSKVSDFKTDNILCNLDYRDSLVSESSTSFYDDYGLLVCNNFIYVISRRIPAIILSLHLGLRNFNSHIYCTDYVNSGTCEIDIESVPQLVASLDSDRREIFMLDYVSKFIIALVKAGVRIKSILPYFEIEGVSGKIYIGHIFSTYSNFVIVQVDNDKLNVYSSAFEFFQKNKLV